MIFSLYQRFDTFFHRRVPPHLFAIVRIVFGVFLALYWFTQWQQSTLFSHEGISLPKYQTTIPAMLLLFHPSAAFMQAFFVCMFVLLLCFTAGYAVRCCAAALLLLFLYFHVLTQFWFSTSFYRLFEFTLIVFLFPGADRTFSVRMWLRAGSFFAWEPISILPQRLLALQLTATYFGVGWQKLFLPNWKNGHILWQGFTGRWSTEFGFWLARSLPSRVFDFLIIGTLLLECSISFGLWMKRARGWFFVGGFLFHTLITLTMSIWWFQFLVPLYIVFLTPEEVYAYVKKIGRGRIR